MVCADANVLVRFIMKDNLEQAFAARTSVLSGALFVPTEVFAEVVYVLTKVYKIGRGIVSETLSALLPLVSTDNEAVMRTAFSYYAETRLDFIDCVLAARHSVDGTEILSFDRKLNNFIKRL